MSNKDTSSEKISINSMAGLGSMNPKMQTIQGTGQDSMAGLGKISPQKPATPAPKTTGDKK